MPRERQIETPHQATVPDAEPEPMLDTPESDKLDPPDVVPDPQAEGDSVWAPAGEAEQGTYHHELAASAEYDNQNLFDPERSSRRYGQEPLATTMDVEMLREQNPNAIGPSRTTDISGYPMVPAGRRRDPAIVSRSHQFKVPISRDVMAVKAGTPLKPTATGWVPTVDEDELAIAGVFSEGGTLAIVYKIVTLETYVRQFVSGQHYSAKDIDDYGFVTFEKNDAGPYLATSDTEIIMDATRRG